MKKNIYSQIEKMKNIIYTKFLSVSLLIAQSVTFPSDPDQAPIGGLVNLAFIGWVVIIFKLKDVFK